ncbi:MAG: ATP-dependent RecD-like DNA helicase [Chloroflexia bacterium]
MQDQTVSAQPTSGDDEVVDGVLERITYINEENGYTVARLKVPRYKKPVTIAGYLPAVSVGEGLRLEGKWVTHPQYGHQLMVTRYQSALPSTVTALKRYLGSGLLKGVGPAVAEHIVNVFGMDTLDVLNNHPERLVEVPGMGARKAENIANAWSERRSLQELMGYLQSRQVPVALAVRIAKKYGQAAATVVRQQPYRLAAEIYGISFDLVDELAAQAGIARDANQRIAAGLTHSLRAASEQGHVFLTVGDLVTAASTLLKLPQETILRALPAIAEAGHLDLDTLGPAGGRGDLEVAYLPELHAAEISVSESIRHVKRAGRDRLAEFRDADWETAWRYVASRETVHLTGEQQEAVRSALTERVAVITGGPGTGKTTTLRSIVRLLGAKNKMAVLAAPTGRAAKRLAEATGAPASTIHRLLELRPGGSYEARAKLEADMVIIDEASMMDLPLCEALLRAVPPGAHLLFVGDADQLPPVGPGSVFRDIIASGLVPYAVLETIFRQPDGSAIVSNAHRINAGSAPLYGKQITDFFFFRQPSPAECADLVVDLATRRVPARFGLDSWEDIQVMSPIYKGQCGVEALNARLQEVLNPPDPTKDERRYGDRIFRVGDKVMQVVNDYDKQVANGDIGRIVRIDLEEKIVEVSFDGEWTTAYSFQDLDELSHAYAISVHKAQGSEYPAVIMPVLPQHGRLLQRNLLYTAISRARRLVVLAGSPEALSKGVTNDSSTKRNSGLVYRLRS